MHEFMHAQGGRGIDPADTIPSDPTASTSKPSGGAVAGTYAITYRAHSVGSGDAAGNGVKECALVTRTVIVKEGKQECLRFVSTTCICHFSFQHHTHCFRTGVQSAGKAGSRRLREHEGAATAAGQVASQPLPVMLKAEQSAALPYGRPRVRTWDTRPAAVAAVIVLAVIALAQKQSAKAQTFLRRTAAK